MRPQARALPAYRRDIDGLRALAVVPVVLFHAGVPWIGGGFIGVDVFFVISGFLITSIIAGEMEAGTFSILKFYERRIRRIVPALVVVTAASCILAWLYFMPVELEAFGWSVAAAMLSASNFLFWRSVGYFDAGFEFSPLLHTWSLAVEEQFYVVFPLLLLALKRWQATRLKIILWSLAAVSFVISAWLAASGSSTGFYMLWPRAWELLLGSLVALGAVPAVTNARLRQLLQGLGLLLIVVPVFLYTRETPFPGVAALPPCLGAAFLIHAGGGSPSWPQRLLANPVMAGIGLISYSLYLWHWPLIVFATYATGRELDAAGIAGVIGVSTIASILTWRFVEQPFRRRKVMSANTVYRLAGAGVAACTGFGVTVALASGVPQRLPDKVRIIYDEGRVITRFAESACFIFEEVGVTVDDIREGRTCSLGVGGDLPLSFILWGDSHAAALAPGIDHAAKAANRRGLFIGHGSCPPLIGYQRSERARHVACKLTTAATLELVAAKKIPLVIMTSRWPRYVNGANYGNEGPFFNPLYPIAVDDKSEIIAERLDATLEALTAAGAKAIIMSDVPEVGYDVPYVLARAAWQNRTVDIKPRMDRVQFRQGPSLRLLEAAAKAHGARLIVPLDVLCGAQSCLVEKNGKLLYTDEDHLSVAGALSLSGLFETMFRLEHSRGGVQAP